MITSINGYVGHTEEDGEKWTVVLHLTCESETEAKGFLDAIIGNVNRTRASITSRSGTLQILPKSREGESQYDHHQGV